MRRVVTSLALALVLVPVIAGCDDKKPPAPAPTPSATASATTASTASAAASASASAAAGDAAAPDSKHMANCPTAVPGATIALKDVEGGIEVTVTGKDEATTKDIKERLAKLVEADKKEAAGPAVKHDHSGSGGGRFGHCTIVMKNTKLETADVPNGVKITVKASDKSEVDWVRRETRDRDKAAKAPGGGGAGSKRMAHCPSAVEGAKTTVKDTKEGVVVTVTGTGDGVKEIRERAKHTAEVAKMAEPAKVEHDSQGKGGGGLGHCPVVVEGDTTVEVKDVEGGSEITVKTKKDPAALQKEAKARAAALGTK